MEVEDMGIIDAFTADARVELKVNELMNIMRDVGKADVIYNGVKANVPHKYLRACINGNEEKEVEDNVLERKDTECPDEEGI
jgi:hypothetical protein